MRLERPESEDVEYEYVFCPLSADAHEGEGTSECANQSPLTVDDEDRGKCKNACSGCHGGQVVAKNVLRSAIVHPGQITTTRVYPVSQKPQRQGQGGEARVLRPLRFMISRGEMTSPTYQEPSAHPWTSRAQTSCDSRRQRGPERSALGITPAQKQKDGRRRGREGVHSDTNIIVGDVGVRFMRLALTKQGSWFKTPALYSVGHS